MTIFWTTDLKVSSIQTLTSSPHIVAHSNNLRSRPIQTSSSSRRRSTSISISAVLSRNAQPNSSTSENLSSFLFHNPFSMKSSGIETSCTVHSNSSSTHLIWDLEAVFSLSAINTADLPYHTLEEKSRSPTPELYFYPLSFDNQMIFSQTKSTPSHPSSKQNKQ